jgi:hypothetical protein
MAAKLLCRVRLDHLIMHVFSIQDRHALANVLFISFSNALYTIGLFILFQTDMSAHFA